MKFLLEFVSCCGVSNGGGGGQEVPESVGRRSEEETREVMTMRNDHRRKKRGRGSSADGNNDSRDEWKPSLSAISENNMVVVGERRVERVLNRKGSVAAAGGSGGGRARDIASLSGYGDNYSGLKPQFMPFITAFNFATREKELSLDDFQTEILNFETLMEASNTLIPTETNLAFAATHSKSMAPKRTKGPSFTNPSRSPNSYSPRSPNSYSRSPAHMGSFPNKPNTNHPGDNRPTCQICTKKGHMALDCYNRFNFSYQGRVPPSDLAAMAAEGNSSHTQHMWYADSGANAHITNNTTNLTTSQPYEGDETITVGNGSGTIPFNERTDNVIEKLYLQSIVVSRFRDPISAFIVPEKTIRNRVEDSILENLC
ncbi:hypothetical protein DKX38_017842 [Salix brachista]|uniref:CCHC-type domain-containing protein n=1 Tax=Salix brachista TaxID=2182728 RepID=A0A5N5KXN4_9ROSI|nr:hypothetical protein DKX38_017842 [Salix brachista]